MFTSSLAMDINKHYPGDEYIDIVGFSALTSIPSNTAISKVQDLNTQYLATKIDQLKSINKITYIMNMGIQSSPQIQKVWIDSTVQTINNKTYPKILGLIYFNSNDNTYNLNKNTPIDYLIPHNYLHL